MATDPLVRLVGDDEVEGPVKELFEQMIKMNGAVPKWMRVMANNGDVLLPFFGMFRALMDEAPVDKKLKWKLAYKVSELNKCEYCVSISQMQLEGLGFEKEEVANLKDIEKALTDDEKVAFKYAEAATKSASSIDPKIFEALKGAYDDEQIVELTAVVSLFNFINTFNDALGVLPD